MVNLHNMLRDLTLTFITRGKHAENRETGFYYELKVEWQPEVSRFRVRFPDQRSLSSRTTLPDIR